MPLKHDHVLNPIAAISFCRQPNSNLILAAEGLYLKIFESGATRVIAQCLIFREQIIHGIAVNGDDDSLGGLQIVVWGGSSLTILHGPDLKAILESRICDISSREVIATDWILGVALSPNPGIQDFVLLTAHNALIRARFSQNPQAISFQSLDSPSRSILYSAHIIWLSSSSIMVAAGTVFGEIIIWHCHLGETPEATILFTFTGHEGSIFGVHMSDEFRDSKGNVKRLLASCSDDRTIRLHDISLDSIEQEENVDPKSGFQEKGFGDNSRESQSVTEPRNRFLAVAWGHASRIWNVRTHLFSQGEANPDKIGLLSFGEDATCQLWSIDFESDHLKSRNIASSNSINVQLRHRKTFAYHSGKHIWAAGILSLDNSHCLVATGGADGKLSCFQISSIEMDISGRQLSQSPSVQDIADAQYEIWTLDEILLSLPTIHPSGLSLDSFSKLEIAGDITDKNEARHRKNPISKKDGLNRYSFITDNKIVLTSTAGRVFLGTCEPQNQIEWEEIQSINANLDLREYSVITSIPELGLAIFAGANGNIYRLQNSSSIDQIGSVKGKVAALFLTRNQSDARSLSLLVTVLGSLEVYLLSWNEDAASKSIKCSSISLPPNFIVTSASKVGAFIYVGSRGGAMGVLDPNNPINVTFTYRPPPSEDADAVTSIIEIPGNCHESCIAYILATSRNGTYKIFSLHRNDGIEEDFTNISMVPRHHSAPPLGSIENAWFEDSNLYLYGFRGKLFIVWNETQKFEVMAVECGGAHRSYTYSHLKGTLGGGTFVYTKVSKLYLHSHRTGSHKIIKDGGHGREMKVCAVSSGKEFLATGAEDTTIRIWNYRSVNANKDISTSKFECLSVIEKHTAGIQHLQWQGDNYLFSSGGTEEFYIWAIQDIPNFGIGVICEAALLDQSPEKDLRIMSFDIMEFPQDGSNWDFSYPEKTFLISLAFSDSEIKSYLYSKTNGFKCIAKAKHTNSCLTQLRHLHHPSPSLYGFHPSAQPYLSLRCDIYLMTAGTDGQLTTWVFIVEDIDTLGVNSMEPIIMTRVKNYQLHQNAIKTMDLMRLSNDSYVVATGGDDNALAIAYYGSHIDQQKTIVLKNAHGAAITALTFLDPSTLAGKQSAPWSKKEVALRLVSSSNDQRVKLWDVKVLDDGFSAFIDAGVVGDEFTSVADIGDMAVLRLGGEGKSVNKEEAFGKVVVVGNGMDVWDV